MRVVRLLVFFAFTTVATFGFAQELTLEKIMSDPDWLGNSPERPYWADDGDSIYFSLKVPGEERRELYKMGVDARDHAVVEPADRGAISVSGGDWSRDGKRKVYVREGDIYVRTVRGAKVRQLTRTSAREQAPRFMSDERFVQFVRGDSTFVRDLDSGLEREVASLRTEDDPDAEDDDDTDYLAEQQERLLDIVRLKKEREESRKEHSESEQSADPSRVSLPWYLGEDYEILDTRLSPSGKYMFVALINEKEQKKGKAGRMPNYVTESGYTETRDVRPLVGTAKTPTEEFLLLDLVKHEKHSLDLKVLPGILEDPLEAFREAEDESGESDEEDSEDKEKDPKPRPVALRSAWWSNDGDRLVLDISTRDNKDRWIVSVDLDEKEVVSLHHERDEAWVNYARRLQTGWLGDTRTLYFVSEQDGYAHLYAMDADTGEARQLTSGTYEVSSVTPSRDGKVIYFLGNPDHPGVYEVYRVAVATGNVTQLTELGGNNRYVLSPDEKRLLIAHSTLTKPYELYVQRARPGAVARRLTHTISEEFEGISWVEPEVALIPSSHVERPVYSRVYTPDGDSTAKRPAVVFVHGAGYLQNSHLGWSNYFREFMFHSLLVQKGYVVLDMDYRASLGYGRDWRTAIYRRMGTPELEDLQDGVAWLAANKNVDPARIGVYGGSYGGFMTLMALFRAPDLFACGAALRPVTDWAHYNHGYTSNILNVPELDPEAYENSSPIEFAEGLTKPLLICHGMQDNNVFYQDSVRLAQRLIELKKENWELASYPIEAHGFREPTSWLDEYRRILKLFETNLKKD